MDENNINVLKNSWDVGGECTSFEKTNYIKRKRHGKDTHYHTFHYRSSSINKILR